MRLYLLAVCLVLFAISFESTEAQNDLQVVEAVRATLRSPAQCRRRYSASTCRTAALIIRLVRQAGSGTGAELLLGDEEEEAGDEDEMVGQQCSCRWFRSRRQCRNFVPSQLVQCQRFCCGVDDTPPSPANPPGPNPPGPNPPGPTPPGPAENSTAADSTEAQSGSFDLTSPRLVDAVRAFLRSPAQCRRRFSASTCRSAAFIIRLVRRAGSNDDFLVGEEESGNEVVAPEMDTMVGQDDDGIDEEEEELPTVGQCNCLWYINSGRCNFPNR